MKKLYSSILFLLVFIHFLFLHIFGIASFTTTVLFYYLLYIAIKQILDFFIKVEKKNHLINNLKILIIFLLIIEFSLTFFFKIMNNYFENKNGIYLSEYKIRKQIELLHLLGKSNGKTAWENGYTPLIEKEHISPDFNYSVKTNQLGTRGELPALKKDSNEYRIVVLGDSFVEGFGAPEDSSTFPMQLKKHLQNQKKKISVINGGICGSNPIYEITLYNKILKKYNPDLVILETNMYDILDIKIALNQDRMPLAEYFKAISHIYRSFYLSTMLVTSKFNTTLIVNSKKTTASQLIIKNLFQFKTQLSKNNQLLLIIYQPSLFEVTEYYDFAQPSKELQNAIHKSNIPYIDLKEEYVNQFLNTNEDITQYYWFRDGHHNPKGYELMARITAQKLLKFKPIKESLKE